MENQTNIHIEWLETPASGWDEKVNIMLASGDLPDAFSYQVKDLMKNSSLFTPLNEYVDKCGPHIQEMFEGQPDLKSGCTAPDGNMYSLPTNRFDPSNTVDEGMWVNTEWLKALNLEMPTTVEEFEAMLRAFRDQDPNGNGIADEIPLGVCEESNVSDTEVLFGPFGVIDTEEYVFAKDGKVLFTAEQEGYLKGLQWMNKLYNEKLMDPEVFTQTGAQFQSKAQDPAVLYGVIMVWLPDAFVSEYLDIYEAIPPLKGENGEQLWSRARQPGGYMDGFAITTKCKNPEALVRYYDNNISTTENIMLWYNGPAGEGIWKYDTDGEHWMETSEFMPEGVSGIEFKRTVAAGPYSPARLWSKYDDLRIQEPRIKKRIAVNEMYIQYGIEVMPKGMEDPDTASQRALLFTDIDNYMKKFKANAVVEGITDAQWQEHLENLKRYNVDEYIRLWQVHYDSKQQ
ncbi:MAG: extracellular solute-binding protein [Provencibacterium sp.]|jgi:putative aldouronate transport system substrate-binding protein|nr:extracellular solute-binding protein [Provencibacterium sp.]